MMQTIQKVSLSKNELIQLVLVKMKNKSIKPLFNFDKTEEIPKCHVDTFYSPEDKEKIIEVRFLVNHDD